MYIFFSTSPCQPEIVAGLTTSSFYAVHCQRRSGNDPDVGSGLDPGCIPEKSVGFCCSQDLNDATLEDSGMDEMRLEIVPRKRGVKLTNSYILWSLFGVEILEFHDEHFLEVC